MPHTITFDKLPMGYAASAAKADAAVVKVQYTGFTSTEDGQRFIKWLEGIPNDILGLLTQQCGLTVSPSQVDHMLAIVRKDRTATVYLNEVGHLLRVRVSRAIKAGEAVSKDDIADICEMELEDIAIPPDSGVVYLFSVGWRKGLFYDFGPLNPLREHRRNYDCSRLFAELFARVLFQERFSILEPEWDSLFKAKLFPFAGLKNDTIAKILAHLRAGWDLAELSETIVAEVKQRIPAFLESWRKHVVFTPHIQFLERAAQRFNDDDYISSDGILLPRIEGILRTHHVEIRSTAPLKQANLAESAVASDAAGWLLLPDMFKDYLTRVYFAGFSPTALPCDSTIPLSRHSVAHGVAPPEAFTPMHAAVSFLVLHQLFYSFTALYENGLCHTASLTNCQAKMAIFRVARRQRALAEYSSCRMARCNALRRSACEGRRFASSQGESLRSQIFALDLFQAHSSTRVCIQRFK